MSVRIVLEILPKTVSQCVFWIWQVFQNVSKLRLTTIRLLRETKGRLPAEYLTIEANNQNTLTVLRNPRGGINDLAEYFIVKIIERLQDRLPRVSILCADQSPNVGPFCTPISSFGYQRDQAGILACQPKLRFPTYPCADLFRDVADQ